MSSSYIDVAGTTSGKDKEKARQYWAGLNRVQTDVQERAAASSRNFIPWDQLVPANISEPVHTAYIIDGVEYTMEEIEPYIQEGWLELNTATNEYEWAHREPA